MVDSALRRVLGLFRLAALAGLVGLLLLGIAIATASLRFGACGPSAMDAVDSACRTGARLLMAAYAVLSLALVLGATSLTLLWRRRRDRRRPHRP